jgi:hypothetical protein
MLCAPACYLLSWNRPSYVQQEKSAPQLVFIIHINHGRLQFAIVNWLVGRRNVTLRARRRRRDRIRNQLRLNLFSKAKLCEISTTYNMYTSRTGSAALEDSLLIEIRSDQTLCLVSLRMPVDRLCVCARAMYK